MNDKTDSLTLDEKAYLHDMLEMDVKGLNELLEMEKFNKYEKLYLEKKEMALSIAQKLGLERIEKSVKYAINR